MSLVPVIDAVASRLGDALGSTVSVGDIAPDAVGGLPAVVLSIAEAEHRLEGVGRVPRATRTGALRTTAVIDLADPVLDLGGGETLNLLANDRRSLTLPHGPVVRADGVEDPPFAAGDVIADDGTPFAVVAANPNGHEVIVDPVMGTLQFGEALAASGQLRVTYHLGQWDSITTRYQGALRIDVVAADAPAARGLSRQIAAALAAADPSIRVLPTGWGPVAVALLGDDAVRNQSLAFHFDAEIETPVLTTSGGVISTVAVTGRLGQPDAFEPLEDFEVLREGSPT